MRGITIKCNQKRACAHTRRRKKKKKKSHETSNISSIKTQQRMHTAATLVGGREINRQLSGDAPQHVTRQAARKQLAGRGHWVQTQREERKGRKREEAEARMRLFSKENKLNKPAFLLALWLWGWVFVCAIEALCCCFCEAATTVQADSNHF